MRTNSKADDEMVATVEEGEAEKSCFKPRIYAKELDSRCPRVLTLKVFLPHPPSFPHPLPLHCQAFS